MSNQTQSNTNIFEVACREKFRYPTARGIMNTEDLWHLPIKIDEDKKRPDSVDLNDIYLLLKDEYEKSQSGGLVKTKGPKSTTLEAKIKIIEHIANVKTQEAEAVKQLAANKAEKQFLMQVIEEKKKDSIKGKTLEELQALIAKM